MEFVAKKKNRKVNVQIDYTFSNFDQKRKKKRYPLGIKENTSF